MIGWFGTAMLCYVTPKEHLVCFADASKAKRELGWEATRGLEEMCADSWRWQSENKTGYQKVSN